MSGWRRLVVLVLLLAGCASTPTKSDPPIPFSTDGCSDPTGAFKKAPYEQACCVPHDRAYWRGGTWEQRQQADEALRVCVAAKGYPRDAELMWAAVRLGGGPEHDTPYRWGYGYPFPHPYDQKEK